MKVEDYKRSKLTLADFWVKFLFAQIWVKSAQKWTFLHFLKIQSLVFSDIVHEVREQGAKIDRSDGPGPTKICDGPV